MSKSLKRVRAALEAAGSVTEIVETPLARTAADAAAAIGCEIDQIAKSIIFRGEVSGNAILFLTAGGNKVDPARAAARHGRARAGGRAPTISGVASIRSTSSSASFTAFCSMRTWLPIWRR